MKFNEPTGDFTNFTPQKNTIHLVLHGCNNYGVAGSGAILAVKKNFPLAIDMYHKWFDLIACGQEVANTTEFLKNIS